MGPLGKKNFSISRTDPVRLRTRHVESAY